MSRNGSTGKIFAQNRKARHDFSMEETYEAGIQLTGPEVKSIREGRANLQESYVWVRDGEVFLLGAHVSPYENAREREQLPPASGSCSCTGGRSHVSRASRRRKARRLSP